MQREVLQPPMAKTFYLQCHSCKKQFSTQKIQTYCSCGHILQSHYDFIQKPKIRNKSSLWRYLDFLPFESAEPTISLGEGWTPILSCPRMAGALGLQKLMCKDEGLNPTGSFKARGMAVAINKAYELGISTCVIPSAGNAGVALSAYGARAGIQVTIVLPGHTPSKMKDACSSYGARLVEVDGLLDACGEKAQEIALETGAFNMATMKEPYRLEGKKTMGLEIGEQLKWKLPDFIIYPTGGGTGLLGIWKAFMELKALGWIREPFPRMIAVQSANCQPVVDAFYGTGPTPIKASVANGLAVPVPFAINEILEVLHESKGMAMSVAEEELMEAREVAFKTEGISMAPEGGAAVAAARKLKELDMIKSEQDILVLNTSSSLTI